MPSLKENDQGQPMQRVIGQVENTRGMMYDEVSLLLILQPNENLRRNTLWVENGLKRRQPPISGSYRIVCVVGTRSLRMHFLKASTLNVKSDNILKRFHLPPCIIQLKNQFPTQIGDLTWKFDLYRAIRSNMNIHILLNYMPWIQN